MNSPLAPNFYQENEESTLALTGHNDLGVIAVFDGRTEEGVFLRSVEEAQFVRNALDQWIKEATA